MKKEYTANMNYYHSKDFELILKNKNVVDAHQFIHTSMLYLNYAVIAEKLYQDIGKKNISESSGDPFYDLVNVLGWEYKAHTLLNKCALEWFSHISNALDCLLQYINSALNLGIPTSAVSKKSINNKIKNLDYIIDSINTLWSNDTIKHIQSIYNYSKHTLDLYGGSSFTDVIDGQRDILIPNFRFKGNEYPQIAASNLMNFYENFIQIYLNVLDSVNLILSERDPIANRYYIDAVSIDDHLLGQPTNNQSLTLSAKFKENGNQIEKYWFNNPSFPLTGEVQIMLSHSKNIGQHMGKIDVIEVLKNNQLMGYLKLQSEVNNSILEYHRYKFVQI